jgi:hypothetical protein
MADDVSIRVRILDALRFKRDADMEARAIDNIGDQARQAARGLAEMNAASSKTRVNVGPFSTSMRFAALGVGAVELASGKAVPAILSAAEAVATLAGGAGGAGAVGLTALAQLTGVASLGLTNLEKALGGDATAAKKLSPELMGIFDTLSANRDVLAQTATDGMLGGLTKGTTSALRNFGILRRLTRDTSREVGHLADDAGRMLGSKGFGRDLRTVGGGNVRIIDDLGHAGLNLASALEDVLVEADPLAIWMAREIRDGARMVEVWSANARASGEMARFFRQARTDLSLLVSVGGHTGHGLVNLFGSQDVDGTKTLRNLDLITSRFETWTSSPAVRRNLGQAVIDEIPKAVTAVLDAVATTLPHAGGLAARTFFQSFMDASLPGKLLSGAWLASKLGIVSAARKGLGNLFGGGRGGGGALGAVASRGATPANPVWVAMVDGPGGKGSGLGRAARRLLGPAAGAAADAAPFAAGGAAVGAGVIGGLILLGKHQHGPATPQADRLAGQRAAIAMGGHYTPQRVDAQGFPDPHGRIVVNVAPTVHVDVDGQRLGRAVIVAQARADARTGSPGLTPAYNAARRAGP